MEEPIKTEKKTLEEFVLTINVIPSTSEIKIDGPLHNEMLCLWMLEKAKDTIKVFVANRAKLQKSQIVKPHGILDFARRRL